MTTPGLAILTGDTLSVGDTGPSGDVIMTSLLGIALLTDSVVSVIPAGTAGQVLTSNGPNAPPTFQNVPGTLPPVVLGLGFDLLHLGTLLTPTNTNQTLTHDSSSTVNAALMNAPITQPSYWEITVNHTAGSTDIRLGVGINSISLTAALGATGGASVQDNGVVTVNGSTGTPQSALPSTTIGVAVNPSTKRLWVGAPGAPAGSGIDISALSGLLYPAISLNGNVTAITINTQPTLPSGYNALVAGSVPIPPVTPATIGFDPTHTSTDLVLSSSNTIATRNSTGSPGGECALVNAPITAPMYWELTVIHNGSGTTGEFSWGVGTSAANFQDDFCGDIGSAAVADNGTVVVNNTFPAAQIAPPAVTLGVAYDPVGKRLNVITPGATIGGGTGIDCSALAGATCYPMIGMKTSTSSVSINSNPASVPAGYTALVASATAIPTPPVIPPPAGGQGAPMPSGATVSSGASLASIQAAVNGLASGHALVMGAGTYNFAGGGIRLKSNCQINTSGLVTINGCATDASVAAFDLSGLTNASVRGDVAGHLVLNPGMVDLSNSTNCTYGNFVDNGGSSAAFDGACVRINSATGWLIINGDLNSVNSTMIGNFDWDNGICDGLHVTRGSGQFCTLQNGGDVNRGRNIVFRRCHFDQWGRGVIESAGTADGTDTGTPTYFLGMIMDNNLFTTYGNSDTTSDNVNDVAPISIVARAQTGTVVSNNFINKGSFDLVTAEAPRGGGGFTEAIEINSSNGVCNTFGNTVVSVDSPDPTYGSAGQNFHNNSIYGATQSYPANNTTLGSAPSVPSAPARVAF